MVAAWEWALLGALLLLSAFFSGSETALTSVSRLRIRHLTKKNNIRAALVEKLLENPNRMISTILIGNNLANISITALATSMALRLLGPRGVGVAILVLTLVMLVAGEITPKTYAATNAEKLALLAARPIRILETLFFPAVKGFSVLSASIVRLMGGRSTAEHIFVTKDEIRTLVDLGEGQGTLLPQERDIIDSVFDLNITAVREVMLPRIDMVAVPLETSLKNAWQTVIDTGHSRIPVYQGGPDQIVGIFHAKDLMRRCQDLERGTVREIMREPYFVPGTKRVSNLLREMRQERVHIAVVLDEYGGTAGLAFLEDLVETVIGEIGDEFDKSRPLIETVGPGEIRAAARAAVDDVNEILETDLPQDEFDTVGGLAFHLFGRVPAKNDSVDFNDWALTVEEVDKNRIRTVRIKKRLH